MLRTLILAATMLAGSPQAFAQLSMGPESIGPIKRGWTISDVLASGLPYEREVVLTEGDPNIIYTLKVDSEASIAIWFSSDDTPYSLSTNSPVFATVEGARVGDTLATLQRLYPRGRVSGGLIEGARLGFVLFATTADGRPGVVAFTFDPNGLSDDCISLNRGCPDLSTMTSNGFMVTWLE